MIPHSAIVHDTAGSNRPFEYDCMTRALTITSGLPYTTVHDIVHRYCWIANNGAVKWAPSPGLKNLDLVLENHIPLPLKKNYRRIRVYDGTTIERLLKVIPIGRYVVAIKGHAFAIIDRKIHEDTTKDQVTYAPYPVKALWLYREVQK